MNVLKNGKIGNTPYVRAVTSLLVLLALVACDPPATSNGNTNGSPPKSKARHVTTLAGSGLSVKIDSIGIEAFFSIPFSIAQSGGTLYVTDSDIHSLRTIDTTTARVGTIVTSKTSRHLDAAGKSARFDFPRGAAAAAGGTLYVTSGPLIRKLEYREVD